MELSPLSFNTVAALTLSILALFLYRSRKRWSRPASTPSPPTAGGAWPIIGHLKLFSGHNLPHVALGDLADKHGPIYTIQLGTGRAVVVNSWELAKELFTTHDIVSTRPSLTSARLLGYDMVMVGFAPYGAYWREMRKIVTLELTSLRRLELLKHIRISEVDCFVKELHQIWSRSHRERNNGCDHSEVVVELKRLFGDTTLNMILRMVAGKSYFGAGAVGEVTEARRCGEAIRGFFHYLGMFVMRDALPFLGWLDVGGHEKSMKRVAKELDDLLEGWLEEHRGRKMDLDGGEREQDFMDVMLKVLHGANFAGHDADVVNKSTCLNVIAGATDSTTVILTWAISLLLNNPNILEKAYQELDKMVGKERLVKESDIQSLPYLQVIVKETLRLYPPAPLSAPRLFTEDCTVGGYHVRKGTQLITNIWKIQTDPRVWADPLEFRPERFLLTDKNFDYKGRNFEYIPFGSGRRSCPGTSFGIQMVHLTLASFLHAFEISKPGDGLIDMTQSPGLTNMKATPLEVLVSPRLSPEVYIYDL